MTCLKRYIRPRETHKHPLVIYNPFPEHVPHVNPKNKTRMNKKIYVPSTALTSSRTRS